MLRYVFCCDANSENDTKKSTSTREIINSNLKAEEVIKDFKDKTENPVKTRKLQEEEEAMKYSIEERLPLSKDIFPFLLYHTDEDPKSSRMQNLDLYQKFAAKAKNDACTVKEHFEAVTHIEILINDMLKQNFLSRLKELEGPEKSQEIIEAFGPFKLTKKASNILSRIDGLKNLEITKNYIKDFGEILTLEKKLRTISQKLTEIDHLTQSDEKGTFRENCNTHYISGRKAFMMALASNDDFFSYELEKLLSKSNEADSISSDWFNLEETNNQQKKDYTDYKKELERHVNELDKLYQDTLNSNNSTSSSET